MLGSKGIFLEKVLNLVSLRSSSARPWHCSPECPSERLTTPSLSADLPKPRLSRRLKSFTYQWKKSVEWSTSRRREKRQKASDTGLPGTDLASLYILMIVVLVLFRKFKHEVKPAASRTEHPSQQCIQSRWRQRGSTSSLLLLTLMAARTCELVPYCLPRVPRGH